MYLTRRILNNATHGAVLQFKGEDGSFGGIDFNKNFVISASSPVTMSAKETFNISGADAYFSNNLNASGSLEVAGAATLSNTLIVTQGATLQSTLDVTGESIFAANTTVSGTLKTEGGLDFSAAGGSLKAGNNIALTIDASGDIIKIGQDSPTDGQFLSWDGTNNKVLWETVDTSQGSTTLDDLTDTNIVAYNNAVPWENNLDHVLKYNNSTDKWESTQENTFWAIVENGSASNGVGAPLAVYGMNTAQNNDRYLMKAEQITAGSVGRSANFAGIQITSHNPSLSDQRVKVLSKGYYLIPQSQVTLEMPTTNSESEGYFSAGKILYVKPDTNLGKPTFTSSYEDAITANDDINYTGANQSNDLPTGHVHRVGVYLGSQSSFGMSHYLIYVDCQTLRVDNLKYYNLSALKNVDTTTTSPSEGEVLKFNGTNWVNSAVVNPSHSLIGLGLSTSNFSIAESYFLSHAWVTYQNSNMTFTLPDPNNSSSKLTASDFIYILLKPGTTLNLKPPTNVYIYNYPSSYAAGNVAGAPDTLTIDTIKYQKIVKIMLAGTTTLTYHMDSNLLDLGQTQDVEIGATGNTLAGGHVLKYNSTNQKWENKPAGSQTLADLTDTDFTTAPSDGDYLKYVNNKWVPSTGASSATYSSENADFSAAVDYHYSIDATNNDVEVTMPEITSDNAGKVITVKFKTGSNFVTIKAHNNQTIEEDDEHELSPNHDPGQSLTMISDGTSNWEII